MESRRREATPADEVGVLGLFDEAVAWMVSRGNTGQWGSQPLSTNATHRERVAAWCAGPGSWVLEDRDGLLGFLVVGDAVDYAPPASGPELYVGVLLASRRPQGRGAGRELMAFAEALARQAGVPTLRVDCYGGGDGRLVEFYESCGFARQATADVGGWPAQILAKELRD